MTAVLNIDGIAADDVQSLGGISSKRPGLMTRSARSTSVEDGIVWVQDRQYLVPRKIHNSTGYARLEPRVCGISTRYVLHSVTGEREKGFASAKGLVETRSAVTAKF